MPLLNGSSGKISLWLSVWFVHLAGLWEECGLPCRACSVGTSCARYDSFGSWIENYQIHFGTKKKKRAYTQWYEMKVQGGYKSKPNKILKFIWLPNMHRCNLAPCINIHSFPESYITEKTGYNRINSISNSRWGGTTWKHMYYWKKILNNIFIGGISYYLVIFSMTLYRQCIITKGNRGF